MKSIDPKDLILALAGPWANPARREARLKSCSTLPAELVAIAERHAASGPVNFRATMPKPLEGIPA